MTKAMRWRIIVLQVVALHLLVGSSFGAPYGSTFATDQIKQQLEPQQIFSPKDMTRVMERRRGCSLARRRSQ